MNHHQLDSRTYTEMREPSHYLPEVECDETETCNLCTDVENSPISNSDLFSITSDYYLNDFDYPIDSFFQKKGENVKEDENNINNIINNNINNHNDAQLNDNITPIQDTNDDKIDDYGNITLHVNNVNTQPQSDSNNLSDIINDIVSNSNDNNSDFVQTPNVNSHSLNLKFETVG